MKTILGAGLFVLIVCTGLLVACSSGGYKGPKSDHFDGTHFFNQSPTADKTLSDLLRWRLNRKQAGAWEKTDQLDSVVEVSKRPANIVTTFINHATVLVQIEGMNILTDPVWSERVSPVSFVGPSRFHPPAMALDDLPPIDAVIISHNHYDHLDLATLKELQKRFNPVFIVGLGNRRLLGSEKLSRIVELDWWQDYVISPDVVITGTPAQHWSTRTRLDRNKTLWLGYLIRSQRKQIFFAGDTGAGPHFKQIRERYGDVNLALLPIGAYLPRWFMKDNHLSPDDALQAHYELGAKQSMAIHFGTFNLGDDGQFTAAKRLESLLAADEHKSTAFMIPEPGQQLKLSQHGRAE